jgi:hypothetical protein
LELKDSEGNDIAATIDSGVPSLTVADDGSASVKLDVSDGDPEVYVYDGTASVQLIIKTGPGVYLDDGSGSTISLDIESDAELVITDGTNTSTLTAGDLTLDGGGTIECNGDGCEITVADDSGNSTDITAGDITLDDNGEFCVGDSTLKDGDLNLGDSGTIECGSSGSVSVGDSTLASGSLALGSSGDLSCSSIECDTISTTGDVSVGGNLDCASLSIGGTDIDTYIQDVVNQMTWTATCSEDGTSITISAS